MPATPLDGAALAARIRAEVKDEVAGLGDVRTPSIADLFVAVMSNNEGQPPSHEAAARQGSPQSQISEAK